VDGTGPEHPGQAGAQSDRTTPPLCTLGPLRDESGAISYLYISVEDVTEVVAYEKKLIEMNTKDGLTGIYNRRALESQLRDEFERYKRYSRPFKPDLSGYRPLQEAGSSVFPVVTLVFATTYGAFQHGLTPTCRRSHGRSGRPKKLNDRHGHQYGDYVLQPLASKIASRLRKTDFFARYGGEEFCCLLSETPIEAALALAEALRCAIAGQEFSFNEERIHITISLGVASATAGIDEPPKKADDALYRAKETGRNRVAAAC
jgi:diguanylate cyclase (GGDEF)-like protein